MHVQIFKYMIKYSNTCSNIHVYFQSGEGRWTSENGMFLKLVRERSPTHMQSVLNEYKTVSGGEELLDVMKQECPKDYFLSVKTYGNYC